MLTHSHDENNHRLEINSVSKVLVVKAVPGDLSFSSRTLIKLPSFKSGSGGARL